MIKVRSIQGKNFQNKKCLLRLDLNIPLSEDGKILDDTRIIESVPSIKFLLNQSAKVIIISHIGRPKGQFAKKLSFKNLLKDIEKRINNKIIFIDFNEQANALDIINSNPSGSLFMLDNLRFNTGEESSSKSFISFLSSLADVFINDGFGTIHRNHSSITGIAKEIPSYGGILLEKEIESISECILSESNSSTAILGGSKIADKIPIIENLSKSFENIIITGGMIRSFLIASGKLTSNNIEESEIAEEILSRNSKIYIPDQLICSNNIDSEPVLLHASQIKDNDNIYDIGPNSLVEISSKIINSDKLIWNGPPGVFENENFQNGTKIIIKAITESKSKIRVAGGGSTVAAINYFDTSKYFTHISTGGGAFLSLLEGKFLEGIEVLK